MAVKALFLDRDGIVNRDAAYVHRKEDFEFCSGIFDLCRAAAAKGYLLIVATNQSGVERGYFTADEFWELTGWMLDRFAREGISIAEVFFCPSLSGGDRKPAPGMFLKARDKYNIDMAASISLGDKERDIEAALRAGVGTNVLLADGTPESRADHIIKRLQDMEGLL